MKFISKIFLLIIILNQSIFAQENNIRDYSQIQNKLELLKVDIPGLEEPIDVDISQTTLGNFLLAISKIHEVNINISPDLNSYTIINNFKNVTVSDILVFLVKEYDLDIEFTGNILSIKKYLPTEEIPEKKPILLSYNVISKTLSLDLKNDPLEDVFREIMDKTGVNLLFTRTIENTPLSIYLKNVPVETALYKIAESNQLIINKTQDGFFTFDSQFIDNSKEQTQKSIRQKISSNFYYSIIDSTQKIVEVNLQNVPISDVIYTLSDALKLDVFTATSLNKAGYTTVEAKQISFDVLLDKIFQSASAPNKNEAIEKFTHKKENNIYYFGTENQISLRQVEIIPMMYRSVKLLKNPSGRGTRRAGRNEFNSISSSGNFNTPTNLNIPSQNRNNRNQTTTSNPKDSSTSIDEIIPDEIKDGIDIKIDAELNSFIVNGPGAKVERFKNFIQYIDKPVPVIVIEVMILEVNRSAITETGISFGIGDKPVKTSGEFFPGVDATIGSSDINKIIGNFSGFGQLNIGKVVPEFYLDIKAMESAGTIKVKSTPKLTTLNGHKAYMSSGETTYYSVTTQSFYGSQIPQTSEITNYVPIDAELSLEILPFVSGNGQVTLDIQVIQSAFNGERVAEDAPPGLSSREFSSIVRMEDQDVVVLGGIESIKKDNSGSGLPFLARIPVIKWLFSKQRREDTKRNLNILIKPSIIY